MTSTSQILVAEDDKALSMVHRILFEEEGVEAVFVENGEQALQKLATIQPKLILLDILMPKKDGFAVLRKLQEQKSTVPVIVLTNLSSETDRQECLSLGATAVYVKSETDTEELRKMIRKYAGTTPTA